MRCGAGRDKQLAVAKPCCSVASCALRGSPERHPAHAASCVLLCIDLPRQRVGWPLRNLCCLKSPPAHVHPACFLSRFVLLKERNKLHSEKLMFKARKEPMPNPRRLSKVCAGVFQRGG